MVDQSRKAHILYQSWFKLLIGITLIVGIFFRFAHLDHKVYWHDETRTSLRIAGYLVSELTEQAFDGNEASPTDLMVFQHINSDRGLFNTLLSLGANDPKHPPLYYGLAHMWAKVVGDSVAQVRSLSAVLGVIAFPCLFWLCRELFEIPQVAWVAIALFAVSPFHVLYAQEAREYSLWTTTIFLASAALLRALRLQTKSSWAVYALAATSSIYSFTLSVLVLIAHGIYVFGVCNRDGKRNSGVWSRIVSPSMKRFLFGAIAACLSFVPWAALIVLRFSQLRGNTAHLVNETESGSLIKAWIIGLSSVFIDPDQSALIASTRNISTPVAYLWQLPALLLAGYSIYLMCRKTPRQVWLLPVALIGIQVIAMMVPDLILGIRLSLAPRYMIPLYVGVLLATAYCLAYHLTSIHRWQYMLGRGLWIVVLTGGVVSCVISFQAQVWWTKGPSFDYPPLAQIINQANRPLVIANARGVNAGNMISLSYLLDADVRLLLISNANVPPLSVDTQTVYIFSPTNTLRYELAEQYNIQVVDELGNLLKLGSRER
ncbi:MAG TPA: glycosyltransferase family 39 protein [Elainellaceae cyanobacterium]